MKPDSEQEQATRRREHNDASVIAGETDVPVGTVTGEFPAELETSKREHEANTGKHAFLVGAGILLSRIVGLIRQRVFAHYFGISDAAGAFNAAFRIPNFLQNVFGEGALSASFIPVYAKLLAAGDDKEASRVADAVLTLLALVASVIVLICVLITPYIISVMVLVFTGSTRDLTIQLVRIFFPGAGLLVMSAWCLGGVSSHRKFFLSYTALAPWRLAVVAAQAGVGHLSSPASVTRFTR